MRVRIIPFVIVCLAGVFSVGAQTVLEAESSLVFSDRSALAEIFIENQGDEFSGRLALELLDGENRVRSQSARAVALKSGKNPYQVSLPVEEKLLENAEENITWFRLRYLLTDSAGRPRAQGIISLSELLRDIFELRVIAADNLYAGIRYRFRIRSTHPLTGRPVPDVLISAELKLTLKDEDSEDLKFKADAVTGPDGFALLDFPIPLNAELEGEGVLRVSGRKGGILREASEDLAALSDDYNFLILTDKPIYQPGQMLNMRGILLKGADTHTVVAGSPVEFRVEDEDDTVLFQQTVATSSFGIAATVWKIPAGARLGTYSLSVRQAGGETIGSQRIRITRYDLPNFTVEAKPSKSFYLPADKRAEIVVRADYLFGRPVTKGQVRVVRETDREWNWKEQKYEIEEGESREGKADAKGMFRAVFDLTEAHEELADSSWRKFEDLEFTAYYTDLTTNRTEQRRFDVRVTREPIHVYFIGRKYDNNYDLPVKAYVSTFYADGRPAVCDVFVQGSEEGEDKFKTLKRLRTNSYGAGRLEFKRPAYDDDTADMDLQITATDEQGRKGTFADEIYFDDDETLQIETDRAIYRPGESISVRINSSRKTGLVYLDVVRGWSVIDTYFVNLQDGRAELQIPFQNGFESRLKIAAFAEDEDDDLIRASSGVIFPKPQNLQVAAEFQKESYKPGEDARVSFSIVDSIGRAVESVLGVVILDKAVVERARTEGDFGGMFRAFEGWLGYGESFGGVNVKDLNELDLTKPISDDLQLVGEVILQGSYYEPNIFYSRSFYSDARSVYAEHFKQQFAPIEKALAETFEKLDYEHPTDGASLKRILGRSGLELDALQDPWGGRYRPVFEVNRTQDVLRVLTAGPDKTFGTKDDFTVSSRSFAYFTGQGKALDKTLEEYLARTGARVPDVETIAGELGISSLRDRFGREYRLFSEVSYRYLNVRLHSAGPDGKFAENLWSGTDDFDVWTARLEYFKPIEERINIILENVEKQPGSVDEFVRILTAAGLDPWKLLDGYGQDIYLTSREFSRYADRVLVENVSRYGEEEQIERRTVIPVTQEVLEFNLRSRGRDGVENTSDDFTLASFRQVLSERTKDDPPPAASIKNIGFARSATGAIGGTVKDASGAAIPGATITAAKEETNQSRQVTTNDAGRYLIANLPVGRYTVRAEAPGFNNSVRSGVPVNSGGTTGADFTMEVGTVSAMVEIAGGVISVETTNASISSVSEEKKTKGFPGVAQDEPAAGQRSTPRLREYFPETLVWQPELLTDESGRAELNFRMADNITTWQLYTVASTRDGRIGVAEKEIQSFQEFFADLDPPKFLTVGDEIFLPTQIRNYTEEKQNVDVSMAQDDWFSFLGPEKRQIKIASGATENAVFGFRAERAVIGGKQRVSAIAARESDAIEKPVTVRPDGREIVRTESKLFSSSADFELNFPANALAKTPRAEVKIYPNLFSHVTEAVEGLLQRPYGCGEQTISSTYPNLMILKFKSKESVGQKSELEQKAADYLQKGFERLLSYQAESGGFSYWGGKEEADTALTGYAIRFLSDANGFVAVDKGVIKRAQDWLIARQNADGSWSKKYSWETVSDAKRTMLLTSYIARTLARLKAVGGATETSENSLQKALGFLKKANAEIDEPYALALFGLASLDAGNSEEASALADKLAGMAISEGTTAYWKLETNTPFYGWGQAGRIETTALVVQLLIKTKSGRDFEDLISRGTLFLLKNKDRYGVWYSTQTTINVLDAFLAALSSENGSANETQAIQVFLNGENLRDLEVLPEQIAPFTLDLSDKLNAAGNRLEIRSSTASPMLAQTVAGHYIDWRDGDPADLSSTTNESRQLRLGYNCDRQRAEIMQEISCTVEAERVGFRGYGMLLAEIGTPPGADVSRESLEEALKNDRSLSRYDILPDRIIIYMWSKAGGTRFNFKFRPRYGIRAQTPASNVYDYYNPEAKAIVPPLSFEVK